MKASEFINTYGDFEITETIEKLIPHKPKSVWELQIGDTYFYASMSNTIFRREWTNDENEIAMRQIGRITLTEEELEFKIERMKVYEELKRFAKEFTDEEWYKHSIHKYYLYADYDPFGHINLCIEENYIRKNSGLYFESKEKVREAIVAVGEERIKKYYLGVGK